MKNKIIYLFLLLFALVSCEKEREKVQVGQIVPSQVTTKITTPVVLTDELLTKNLDTIRWTSATFGFQSKKAEYTVVMDLKANNFSKAITLTITADTFLVLSNSVINQKILAMGVKAGTATDIQFKVTGTIHEDYSAVSNIIEMKITPLKVVINYPKLFIAGDHNGWAFPDKDCIYSTKSNDIYEGYIYMANNEGWKKFKLSYVNDWVAEKVIGDPVADGLSGTLQVGNWGGNNIANTGADGVYKIVVNIPELKYSLLKTDWYMAGDFNGWAHTAMTYNSTLDVWTFTGDFPSGKLGFKFTIGSWDFDYGDGDVDGILDRLSNNNISVPEAGNYTITLNLSEAEYTYTIVKN